MSVTPGGGTVGAPATTDALSPSATPRLELSAFPMHPYSVSGLPGALCLHPASGGGPPVALGSTGPTPAGPQHPPGSQMAAGMAEVRQAVAAAAAARAAAAEAEQAAALLRQQLIRQQVSAC